MTKDQKNMLKPYMVTFVVQGTSLTDALHEAESYLNTEGRTVDCNVLPLSSNLLQSNRPKTSDRLHPVLDE